ncbi:MAG: acyl-CoA reductase [Flavobacterium sp.]
MSDSPPFLAIVELGTFLRAHLSGKTFVTHSTWNTFSEQLNEITERSIHYNGWFTPEQVTFSLEQWSDALTEENLKYWLKNYSFSVQESKKIGLILAGNIPLVGFHDFICVLLSGHQVVAKRSSNDQLLISFMANFLIVSQPELKNKIYFVEGKLENFDAVIATGSNNTARYFEYYFKNVPSIIRKNRNSVALLTGKETLEELVALGEDIFRYFGLGCRNVSKLFVPQDYDFKAFFEAMFLYKEVIEYERYANNYDYNKAVYLMSQFKILDNGFLTLKEDLSHASPISSVFYETYNHLENVFEKIENDKEHIQCVVGSQSIVFPKLIPFGQTQKPQLNDYADGIDTLTFLSNL